jgi:NitT/TauT family transport system substrate-binding protein
MGFIAWREVGLNPYGNSIVVNGAWLKANRARAEQFVKVTQRAFAECVKAPEPCVRALVEANGALLYDNEITNWHLVTVLMDEKVARETALGWHDDKRMQDDYKLVDEFLKLDKPFDVREAYTNDFLDRSIRMTAITPPKLF